jgi:hypothetical protein
MPGFFLLPQSLIPQGETEPVSVITILIANSGYDTWSDWVV